MGMDYSYSGSASYMRFMEEMDIIGSLIKSNNPIFISWVVEPYKELSVENTRLIYEILLDFVNHNPDVELPYQPMNEIKECVENKEGWRIS